MDKMEVRMRNEVHLLNPNPENLHGDYLNGAWLRVLAEPTHAEYSNIAQPSTSGNNITGFQVGFDVYRNTTEHKQLNIAGFYFAYATTKPNINGFVTNETTTANVRETTGSLNLRANTIGIYGTHYWPSKAYLDLIAQASTYDGGANSTRTSISAAGRGVTGSAEFGYPFQLTRQWSLEPQTQLAYQSANFQNTADSFSTINFGSGNALISRIGARMEYETYNQILPFLRANLWSIIAGGNSTVTYSSIDSITTNAAPIWTQLGGGFTWPIHKDIHLYGFVDALIGIKHNHQNQYGADAGLGVRFNW
jgi:outer membrane autotransporter protein